MADDCNAPNAKEIPYNLYESLYKFLVKRVTKYVPKCTESVWIILDYTNQEIGYITFDKNCDVTCTPAIKDTYVYKLGGSIFCRKYSYREIEDKHPEYKSLLK